jgi:hypothetical protein
MASVLSNFVFAAASAVAITGAGSASAAVVVLDFEGQTAGTIIDDEYAPLVTVSTNSNGDNDAAVVFDSNNPTGGDDDLGAPFDNPFTMGDENFDPGNILVISEDSFGVVCDAFTCLPPNDEREGGTITFDFAQAVNFLGFNAFDINDSESLTLELFGVGDALLATITNGVMTVADNEFLPFDLGAGVAGVIRAVFTFDGSGAIDDIRFEVEEIPVPAALPLLLTGLAGLGFASRRRKKNA